MGTIRTSIEELKEKIKQVHGDSVKIVESSYVGMNYKATFVHEKLGEWTAWPSKVILGQNHPKLKIKTLDDVKESLLKIHDGRVTIDESTFENTNSRCRFIDIDHGEWWANVHKVAFKGRQHKKRGQLLIAEKMKISHSNPEFKQKMSETIKAKIPDIQATNLKKYGVISALLLPGNREKSTEALRDFFNTPEKLANKEAVRLARRLRESKIKREKHIKKEKDEGSRIVRYKRAMVESGRFIAIEEKILKDIWRDNFSEMISYTYFCKTCKKMQFQTIQEIIDFMSTNNSMSNIEVDLDKIDCIKRWDKYPYKYANFRPDFKANDNLYINADGLYWHCDLILEKDYHFSLRERAESKGIRILQFREDEIHFKMPIVESMIRVKSGNETNRLFARKLTIVEVDKKQAKEFLNKSHLMGFASASHYVTLQDENGNIQALLSILIKKDIVKISRFASALNVLVVGGYSRLFSYCVKQFSLTEVETFVDLRYGTVDSLIAMGFEHIKTTLGWKWTDYTNTYNRLRCKANMDDRGLSEAEHAKELKWHRIYDAGQAKLIWKANGKDKK